MIWDDLTRSNLIKISNENASQRNDEDDTVGSNRLIVDAVPDSKELQT
jgi:hypothetical protein